MTLPVLLFMAMAASGLALVVTSAIRSRHVAPDFGEFMVEKPEPDVYEQLEGDPFLRRLTRGLAGTVAARLDHLVPAKYMEDLDRQLVHAGFGGKRRAGEQLGRQLGMVALGALLVPLVAPVTPMSPMLALMLPVVGFMLPSVRLKRAIRSRSDAIFKDLPDIVDMLAITVEAGSGFEAAISTVSKNFKSPLTDELMIALHEMELGLSRREALQALRDRVDVDAVRTLILSLLQADALGIPVGRVLKSQATEVRARRRAWAREKAAKLPVKIMFPLVMFIFPPIMGLVLGPAAFSFSQLG